MRPIIRFFFYLLLAALFVPAPLALAQAPADPSGHWEGTIKVPDKDVKFEVDLAKNSQGELAGTFTQPADGIKGLPLATVTAEGGKVTLALKAGSGGGTFHGKLSADGKGMSGAFVTNEGGHEIPFELTRTGEARIAAAPKSPRISKELEGTWEGTLEAKGKKLRLLLKMANQPDGTSTGSIKSVDESGLEIPVAMTQKESNVTIDMPTVGASLVVVLNADATELAGAWKQGPASLPLTMRRK